MNKNKFIILSFIISSIAFGKNIGIDDAFSIFKDKSTTTKNLRLDKTIREETTKELLNGINKDLKVTATTEYSSDSNDTTLDSQISYKDFYLSLIAPISDFNDRELLVGYSKTLNELLYNTDKASIYENSISNINSDFTDKQSLINSLSDLGGQYLSILNQENTIKSTNILIEEKQKELEIAKIKNSNETLSSYDVKVIELSLQELKTQIKIAETEKSEMVKEFNNLLGTDDNVVLENISNVDSYNLYSDDSTIKVIKNNIELSNYQLKGLKVNNLPTLTAEAYHDLDTSENTIALEVTWLPLDYKGDEKSKELNIEKLENQLKDAEKSYDLSIIQTKNSIEKLELNTELSKQTLDLSKVELEKYKIMKEKGGASEYDYYEIQKTVLDNEISYLNNLNSLNLAKKLQNIYSSL